MITDAHLELKGISKVFKSDLFKKPYQAVDDLSCVFARKKCTALMGHNGAGKTTTIRMIFDLIRPSQGEILFNNRAITWNDRALIGYMPEVNKLPLNLNPDEILTHQLRIFPSKKGINKKNLIYSKLEEVGLLEHRKKKVKQLSKGLARRLAWAQATIHEPELLILDEPFSGLDPLGRELMFQLIENMKNQGKTIILCTHELWSVYKICDHVHILTDGQLVFSSSDSQDKNASYYMEISGCSLEALEAVKKSKNLPSWIKSEHAAFYHKLYFQEYAEASSWLQAAGEQSLIIQTFYKQEAFQGLDLLQYFKRREDRL